MPQKKVPIRGMHCRSCEILLEDDLGKIPGVTKVRSNFRRGEAVIEYSSPVLDQALIEKTVVSAGYTIGSERAVLLPWLTNDPAVYGRLLFALVGAALLFILLKLSGWSSLFSLGQIDISELSLVFLIGLTAGISTCAALVGGLVLGVTARYQALHPTLSPRERLIPHFWFHAGRVSGFFVFGLLLGFLGNWLAQSIFFTALITLLAGAVLLLFGLQLSGVFPRLTDWNFTLPKGLARLLGVSTGSAATYTHRSAFIGGALTFFLPCGFTQAVQLAVVALAQPLWGGIILAIFALGTAPGLLAIGGFVSFLGSRGRQWFFPLVAILLIAFGSWNLRNGLHLLGVDTRITRPEAVESTGFAPIENGIQVIRLTQDARGYHPAELPRLKANIPARIIIDSKDSYTCASSFVLPEFGIRRQLVPGENVIEFTPEKSGALPFSCSMGMFRGALEVE